MIDRSALVSFKHAVRLIYGGVRNIFFGHPYDGDIWEKTLNINKSDLVLEIGSGWNPSIRSDVLIEKYLLDKSERRNIAYIPKSRPFIVADGCQLPFVDNAFDYVICRHVIEHLEDPEELLKEIKRVSSKGYISAPSGYWESISAGKYHKWFVFIKDDTLVLEQKVEKLDRKYKTKTLNGNVEKEIQYEFTVQRPLRWEVIRRPPLEDFVYAESDNDYQSSLLLASRKTYRISLKLKILLKETIRKLFFQTTSRINIYQLFACPVCKLKLVKISSYLFCENCNQKYFIINNIPIFLKKKALNNN